MTTEKIKMAITSAYMEGYGDARADVPIQCGGDFANTLIESLEKEMPEKRNWNYCPYCGERLEEKKMDLIIGGEIKNNSIRNHKGGTR